MKKLTSRLVANALLGAAACFSSLAFAHGNHTHGHGSAQVVLAGQTLTVTLDVPLEAYLGFDYPPRDDQQQQKWAAFVARSSEPLRFVEPLPAAGCALAASQHKPDLAQADPAVDIANLQWVIRFDCPRPEALKSLTFTAFRDHPGLKQLRVTVDAGAAKKTQTIRPRFPALMF